MHDAVLPKRRRTALVADLLCGAGGTSRGAEVALGRLGYEMNLVAVNHWQTAINSHAINFPNARHYVQDVSVAKPAELVPEGKLDLLLASPTCAYHSRARGGKPINDQGRMDPWAIVHWVTELRVKRLLIENVGEFQEWGPINLVTGKPIKRRKGEYFRAWIAALRGAGFKVEWRVLNCADFGDATTRQRFFLLGRSDGRRIEWPQPTHCRSGTDMFLPLEKWRSAREIIDWSLEGKSIFNRKRPLAEATLKRIYAGAVKLRWPEPFLVILRNHMNAQSLDDPIPTLTAGGTHIGLAEPFVLSSSTGGAARAVGDPLPTITTGGASNERRPGCARPAVIEPFILNRHGDNGAPARAHSVDAPMPTADCRGAGYLCVPFVATVAHGSPAHEGNPDARRCRSLDEPLQTIHAGGGKFALVEPFISAMRDGNAPAVIEEPLPALTTKSQMAVVEPFVMSGQSKGAPRSVDEPLPGMTGTVGAALIAPYYGSGSGETCTSAEAPLPTVTTKARFGMVVPVTHGSGAGPSPRSVNDPVPTLTTAKGGEFALVMPVTHGQDAGRVRSVEEPLPTVTGAHRGELACIVPAFGEREGQEPRFHSVEEPAPTICAAGRVQLAEGITDERQYDILFRMLEPHELAAATSLEDHVFVGTKTDITKMIGNAVPARTAAALVGAIMRT